MGTRLARSLQVPEMRNIRTAFWDGFYGARPQKCGLSVRLSSIQRISAARIFTPDQGALR